MIERPIYLKQLIKHKDKDIIKVITGVRRCGKSVLLFEIYSNYLIQNSRLAFKRTSLGSGKGYSNMKVW